MAAAVDRAAPVGHGIFVRWEEAEAFIVEAPIGILHAALDGRVLAANPAAAALGVSVGVDWTGAIHPEDRPLARAAQRAALDEGRAVLEARAPVPVDGKVTHLRITLTRAACGG